MLDAIRGIVEGKLPVGAAESGIVDRQAEFAGKARERWSSLTANLDVKAPQRCPHGRYEFDYALIGDFDRPGLADFLQVLGRAVVRHTGWPEFWVPALSRIRLTTLLNAGSGVPRTEVPSTTQRTRTFGGPLSMYVFSCCAAT